MAVIGRWASLAPQATLSDAERRAGLQRVTLDGALTQVMSNLTGGAFLVAYALLLGAGNLTIGLISAVQALSQMLQIPAIYLLRRTGRRKALVVISLLVARVLLVVLALLPWLSVPPLPWLFAALFVHFAFSTVAGLGWNAWMRDLIPEATLGRYMGQRMAIASALGAVVSLAAAAAVDAYHATAASPIGIYSLYFAIGALAGLASVVMLARTPEPVMARPPGGRLLQPLLEPFADRNFRRLLVFLAAWNFAVNLAAPFFTVYMLTRLQLGMTPILVFSILSQGVNVLFFRLWGHLADRFSNKSVLAEAGPLFITTFILWPLTTQFTAAWPAIAILLLIHALAGMSTAGVTLCTGNIALKLAPHGQATAYLAARSLVAGAAATLAPLLGGVMANAFEGERLELRVAWTSAALHRTLALPAGIQGLDFVFLLAFAVGLYALHRLALVREVGEVEKGVVLTELNLQVYKALRSVSNIAGLRDLLLLPYAMLARLLGERRVRARPPH